MCFHKNECTCVVSGCIVLCNLKKNNMFSYFKQLGILRLTSPQAMHHAIQASVYTTLYIPKVQKPKGKKAKVYTT